MNQQSLPVHTAGDQTSKCGNYKKIYSERLENIAIFFAEHVGSLQYWSLQGHPALHSLPQWQLQPWDQSRHTPAPRVCHPHFAVSVLLLYASFPANSDDSPPGSAFPPSDGHPEQQPQRSSPTRNGQN